MSNFNPNAPVFIPTFLRHAVVNDALNGDGEKVTTATMTTTGETLNGQPAVFLVFGPRGAGKTTQSTLLAKEYNLLNISSGDIYRNGKQPFVELHKILQENFSKGVESRYNGVVLDRFVANSEFDAFYIQFALDAVQLPVPFAFMLAADPVLASKRAESRGDNKVGHQYWRAVEQKAQAVTANTIYAPIGRLKKIHVMEETTVDEVFNEIKSTIQLEFQQKKQNIVLPSAMRREHAKMKLIVDYGLYMELAGDVHISVGNTHGRRDTAPLSVVGAYMDKEYFSFGRKNLRSLLSTFHVTLKVDGERFLFVKHKRHGYIGFPAAFTHCYDLNSLFEGVEMAPYSPPEITKRVVVNHTNSPVDFLLDTEMVVIKGQPRFYVLDFIYFWGLEGKRVRFEPRLKALRKYFEQMKSAAHAIVLKDYVPINQLRALLSKRNDEVQLPIDGLIFQHSDNYTIGRDKFLVKWKSIQQCTVDFRLANGTLQKDEWTFELMVTNDVSGETNFGDILCENAIVKISDAVVKDNHLCNGMIVELALVDSSKSGPVEGGKVSQPACSRWSFRQVRNDKLTPNKYSVVQKILQLKHLDMEELIELCEKVPFYESP